MPHSNIAFPVTAGDQMDATKFIGDNVVKNGFYFLL